MERTIRGPQSLDLVSGKTQKVNECGYGNRLTLHQKLEIGVDITDWEGPHNKKGQITIQRKNLNNEV